MRQIFIAGGGDRLASQNIDRLFVHTIGTNKSMMYIPIAMDESEIPYRDCYDYIKSCFNPLGVKNISMVTDLSKIDTINFDQYAAVYIGGGNTIKLLSDLRSNDFINKIKVFLDCGGVVYGGSAGGIVLGSSIITCLHEDKNLIGMEDFNGLDLLKGYSIGCHYDEKQDKDILKCSCENHLKIIAIPETSGIYLRETNITVIGMDACKVFKNKEVTIVGYGEQISLLEDINTS